MMTKYTDPKKSKSEFENTTFEKLFSFLFWYFYVNESGDDRRYDAEYIASSQQISPMAQRNIFL